MDCIQRRPIGHRAPFDTDALIWAPPSGFLPKIQTTIIQAMIAEPASFRDFLVAISPNHKTKEPCHNPGLGHIAPHRILTH